MAEGFINLYANEPSGNRPHYKVTFKLDGVWHEAALWPAKEGKKGFSGKFKPQAERPPKEQVDSYASGVRQDVRRESDNSDIPF